ncbi:glycosyltransferase family 4 protein [Blastopirellula sp. JC732]|uniref:Glycosyltransferase family 4 protein n=1 Tax=Blastopirellula sediminis TaxID=2894196 RepID=A0A9X1MP41_9BACT|nr:glycosyltransferase family 4 protein [Blastopirellula sediminis]MCC9606381.1 glycosyltransferase family 4 protein [Blastopirellula sediminis]MCC9630321.1 glycosyltransferase family 4 protein [Blastopirellula sediminis]
MSDAPLTIASITAGSAGMFCGSCMRDNTIARAMHRAGHDVHLIPTYTPIRTDEENVSDEHLFYGGINVYLEQSIPGYRFLPSFITHWLDRPAIINWATSRGIETSAKNLGALTLSMLRGEHGNQRQEAVRLADWLADSVKPQVINLSNILIGGCIGAIRRKTDAPIVVTLQGDDIFLEDLPEPYKSKSLAEIRKLAQQVDGFIVFSRYYAEFMSEWFQTPIEKFRIVPLGIDVADFPLELAQNRPFLEDAPPTIGYLARLAPEKGLHLLVDAFVQLRQMPGMERAELKIAGYLGAQHKKFAEEQFDKLNAAGLGEAYRYVGEVDRHGKVEFLHSIDVLSTPTIYREPKGLFVLEALASGVPVIQPAHGAFPELLAATGGGHLVPPDDSTALAQKLAAVLSNRAESRRLGMEGCLAVHQRYHADAAAAATIDEYRLLLRR